MLTKKSDLPAFRLSDSPAFVSVYTNNYLIANIRVECEVYHWDDTQWVLVGTDATTPDSSGIAQFSLNEYFAAVIKPKFTYPTTGFITVHKDITRSFKIVFKEYCGTPPSLTDTLNTGSYYLTVKGAIPDHFSNIFFNLYNSFFDKITLNDMRLSLEHLRATAQGKVFERHISERDTVKIFALAKTYTGQLDVTVHLVFSDYTTGIFIPTITPGLDAYRGDIIELDIGYQALGIHNYMHQYYSGKTLIYYFVALRDFFNGLMCPRHKLILKAEEDEQRYEFIFLNSMGAYDTFTATGQSDITMKYEAEILDMPFWKDANLKKRKIKTKTDETVRCNTGFVTEETLWWLPELFTSEEVYILDGDNKIPVIILPGEIMRYTDEPDLYNVEFEYTPIAKVKHDGFDIPPYRPLLTINFNPTPEAGQVNILTLDGTSTPYTIPVRFDLNQLIGLQATPYNGYMFIRFSGSVETTSPAFDITMNEDKNITAHFAVLPPNNYILAIIIQGNGIVKVNGATYSELIAIPQGQEVTLEAVPETNGYFAGFYHNGQLYSYSPYTFTMNDNYIIKAYFSF